ncbi:MAG: YjgP/YjgQ family permease [Candidatus Acidulodesulfobacterium ferriphilum]|uniref:YjgP/YjgQ family permease n=1 Tax=Candidatus Acidulodesulfobacterium ferriphilum TaxID=2597223 RepID=A0A519BBR0_9DELT|nr:MAG: YjgP/YjgQ family permease [Candidatus Acidulodesulfobacterium ferriphilum]
MKIKILQRYLLAEFLKYLAVALLSLAAFYIVVDFISNIGAFTKHSPDAGYVILYFLYKLPEIIYRVLPLSALLSTLLTITFLNKNNEIMPVKSSGLSMFKFFMPLILTGIIISMSSFFLSNFIAVKTNILRRFVMQRYINKNSSYDIDSVYKYRTKDIMIHYKKYIITAKSLDPSKKVIKGVNIYVFDGDFVLNKRYIAEEGYFKHNNLELINGRLDKFEFKNKSEFSEKFFKNVEMPINLNLNFFKSYTLKPEFLSITSLSKMLTVAKKTESGVSYILTGFYSKLSYPVINLILILIGISVGLLLEKKGGTPIAIGISIVFAFTWWIVNSIALSLGESSQLNPLLAAFMADIIFLLFAVYLMADID